ncbi:MULTISPECIES: carbohydrate ABC transporter permease [Clostridia]|uniref:carbohydrate ABC transporter permease n=1 Tax=Clostridia TaxID=186801 RepID=UPI000EA0547E|nr:MULTISPECIES: carbohydrate ABC transporter permease [Clostridia]NBJ68857.1 carbohydrate ABC transporter permease [Roseburia sp. 1XD42-34]RKI80233.1 carbohydrate ABC transporter permease [Clostridium sp. 1xD42-85]
MGKRGISEKTFDRLNILFVMMIVLVITYPVIFIVSASISDPAAVNTGKMWLWPVDITFDGFKKVFQNEAIWRGYYNTIIYTLVGTAIHLVLLLPASYALSRKELKGKKLLLWFILFTMLFNGGLIPTYLVVKSLGMLDTMWAIVIPGVVGAWSLLVARTFFQQSIPDQLVEAAKIDGASDIFIFFRIALPLSAPLIAVMALFHGVSMWNQYFGALIYLSDESKYPLQLVLREILIVNEISGDGMMEGAGTTGSLVEQVKTADLIKYAVMIVSALPLLIIYPFLQKYFVKGVLIGSVKE